MLLTAIILNILFDAEYGHFKTMYVQNIIQSDFMFVVKGYLYGSNDIGTACKFTIYHVEFSVGFGVFCSETNRDLLLYMCEFAPLSIKNICSCLCDMGQDWSFVFFDFGLVSKAMLYTLISYTE